MLVAFPFELQKAADHLRAHDPLLASIIDQVGLPTLQPHTDYYGALVSSIIGQQLSVKAAAAIKQRFVALFGGHFPSPEEIRNKSNDELRAVGFSNAKANYVHDLAEHVLDGRLTFDALDTQGNQEIIDELTNIKGIGEWTAHMFLMFSMGRLDVLPVGDLGIRNGIRALYGLKDAPTPDQIQSIARKYHWHPYESVASWYVWQSLDNQPKL